jgi:hypothetical protein
MISFWREVIKYSLNIWKANFTRSRNNPLGVLDRRRVANVMAILGERGKMFKPCRAKAGEVLLKRPVLDGHCINEEHGYFVVQRRIQGISGSLG